MKKLILTITALFIILKSFGQSKTDTALIAYAKNNGYVQVTDTLHLPKTVKPYYNDMVRYFNDGHEQLKAMYICLKYIRDTPTGIEMSLEDISSIAESKRWNEENAILNAHADTVIINGKKKTVIRVANMTEGNVSGHDGEIWINKDTRQVQFLLSQ